MDTNIILFFSLQWFLNRIARHPEIQQSQSVRVFLESGDFVSSCPIIIIIITNKIVLIFFPNLEK